MSLSGAATANALLEKGGADLAGLKSKAGQTALQRHKADAMTKRTGARTQRQTGAGGGGGNLLQSLQAASTAGTETVDGSAAVVAAIERWQSNPALVDEEPVPPPPPGAAAAAARATLGRTVSTKRSASTDRDTPARLASSSTVQALAMCWCMSLSTFPTTGSESAASQPCAVFSSK